MAWDRCKFSQRPWTGLNPWLKVLRHCLKRQIGQLIFQRIWQSAFAMFELLSCHSLGWINGIIVFLCYRSLVGNEVKDKFYSSVFWSNTASFINCKLILNHYQTIHGMCVKWILNNNSAWFQMKSTLLRAMMI